MNSINYQGIKKNILSATRTWKPRKDKVQGRHIKHYTL